MKIFLKNKVKGSSYLINFHFFLIYSLNIIFNQFELNLDWLL